MLRPELVRPGVGRAFVGGAREVLGHCCEGFRDGGSTLSGDIGLSDDRHGRRAVGAPKIGAGDDDVAEFDRVAVLQPGAGGRGRRG